ncbi:SusC/RagA family TonB-linked outer membrane protein [Ravibacter arvi]|uniref:SusC/RagA family TonB-linked outer membrane protein n=2 Tax=Ravibacter arvi TaxID=2051041 RepID=A0ABP8M3G3_9BACT
MSLCCGISFAQIEIKGTVTSSQGAKLPGVSIMLKSTNQGTITDQEGRYAIDAGENAVLVFSFIGFESQEIMVNGRSTIDVSLKEDFKNLEEVVVTAIGIKQQKRRLGFTTQEVNTEQLANSRTMNLGNALSGQIAGLTVTNPTGMFQAPSFTLRGKTPLIVIDGVPVETDFFDVTGEDIENINVLKGIAASALYGSRGKNGAILITTKMASQEGLSINVSTNNMVTAGFTVWPKTQTEYGSGSNGQYEFWDGADGGISDGDMTWGPKLNAGVKVPQWNSPIRNKVTGETIEWYGDVKGTVYDDRSKYERVPTDFVAHDNLRDFLRTGVVSTNTFSVAYKGDRARYYASGKYAYQQGQVPNMSLNTGSVNFNASFDLTKKLNLETSLSYNKVFSPNYPRYGYGPKNHIYTILLWMSDDVNGEDLRKHLYRPGSEGFVQANYNYAWYNNPYFASYELEQSQNRNVVDSQMKLLWKANDNFNIQARGSVRNVNRLDAMKSPKSYMNYGDSRNGDYKIWNTHQVNFDADVLASYVKDVSDNFQLGLNAGASVFNRSYSDQYQSTDGLIVPFVYSLNNTAGPVQAANSLYEKSIRSVYGAANADFYNTVFVSFTARNDWSSTLPKKGNSYFYPSVSLSTMISEILPMPKAIDYLKLYTSWAQVSSDLAPYSIFSAYNKGVTYGATPSVYYPSGIINPNILPEKSSSYEIGLSSALFKNRLTLDLTYYNIIDENQIMDLEISEASGFTSRKVNGNVYKTNGFEIVAGLKAMRKKDFSWDVSANWSRYVRKITEIYGDKARFGNLKLGDRTDSYYAQVWMKSADGQLILDKKGLPIRDSYLQNLGHFDPSWRLGIQNKFKIKGFDVGVDIDGVWGGIMNSSTIEKMWWAGKHPSSTEFRAAEYAAGKPVYVPTGVVVEGGELVRDVLGNVTTDTRTYTPNTTAVSWQTWGQQYPYRARVTESENKKFANTFDRSFFKLRRVAIGYDLGKIINLGSKIKGLNAQVFAYNLAMWKKMPILDPDFKEGNDSDLQDPSPRYLGVALNLKL